MPVDPGFVQLSDQLLTATVLCYAVAMLGYAVEYAFGARSAVDRVLARTSAAVPAGVGAGVGVDSAAGPATGAGGVAAAGLGTGTEAGSEANPDGDSEPDTGDEPRTQGPSISPERAALVGKAALWLTVLGAITQTGSLAARGIAADRVPWGNMYEFVIAVCLVGVVAWLWFAFRRPVRHLGLFVMLTVVLLLGFAAVRLYTDAGPLVPALNSYWLKIHVTTAILATGLFLVGFVAAAMFLIRDRYDLLTSMPVGSANLSPGTGADTTADPGADAGDDGPPPKPLRFPVTLGERLPDAGNLERIAFRLHALAFPIWTFAIMAGAIWAEEAWTRYWGWDPKETWAFISWVVYAAYLHARATAGWRRSTAAWIAIIGWISMLINLFVINLVIEGLHSYGGV